MGNDRYMDSDGAEFIGRAYQHVDMQTGELRINIAQLQPFNETEKFELKEQKTTVKLKDEMDNNINTEVTTANYFLAHYRSRSSNMSMPCIHPGESVRVYNHNDDSKYYWESLGKDDNLRQTENRTFQIAATPVRIKELTKDNTYFIELDSTKEIQHIQIHTSKANGEAHEYDFIMSGHGSRVDLHDDIGNEFTIVSEEHQVRLKNADKTEVDLNKGVLSASAPEEINLAAPTINFNATKLNISADGTSWQSLSGEAATIQSTGNVVHDGDIQTNTLKTDKVQADSVTTGALNTTSCNYK